MRRNAKILIFIIVFVFTILVLTHVNNPVREKSYMSQSAAPTAAIQPSPSPSPTPEDIFITDSRFADTDSLINLDVESGFPGAVLLVSLEGRTIFHKAYGHLQVYDGVSTLSDSEPMRTDTVFDLASLTKIYSTTLAVMHLCDQGAVSIDRFVYEFLPGFGKEGYDKITIRYLLTHTSGLPSDVKFFRPDVEEGQNFYSLERTKTVSLLSDVPLESEPGTEAKYSDIGYIVLGAVVEQIAGMRLDEYVRANIYEPLSIQRGLSYLPLENGFTQSNIACTERLGNTRDGLTDFPGIRSYTLQGEVHDEKSYYSMGGVSGHAGLFADAQSINLLNQMLLNGGSYNGVNLLSEKTVNEFTSVYGENIYQLGFNHAAKYASLEETVPEGTLCHTGWTGVFSLIDKKNHLSIVLLTNKRHSPVTDGEFEGVFFETGRYFSVVASVYDALGLN